MLLHLTLNHENDVREAFPLCLRGTSLFWYSTEFTALERRLLSSAPVSELCNSLISRFKERPGLALKSLLSSKYSFNDIRASKTVRTHVQEMLRFSRSAGFKSESNTLLLIHNSLDTVLRGHIPEPDKTTTLAQFLASVDAKWSLWVDMAHRPIPFASRVALQGSNQQQQIYQQHQNEPRNRYNQHVPRVPGTQRVQEPLPAGTPFPKPPNGSTPAYFIKEKPNSDAYVVY